MKTCSVCGEEKPTTEFNKHRITKDGLRHKCKVCDSNCSKEYYRKHIEQKIMYQKEYALANRNRIRKYHKYWSNQNKDKIAVYTRETYIKHRDKILARIHARNAKLRNENYEVVNIKVLFRRDNGICGICNDNVNLTDASHDHILPVSKGGENTYVNARLTHLRCNLSRGNRWPAQLRLFS